MREYTKSPQTQAHTLERTPKASNQAPTNVILQRYKARSVQLSATDEDDELLQGKFENTTQLMDFDEDEETLQGKFDTAQREQNEENNSSLLTSNFSLNRTGLPDNLKTGIENLSGYNMDDVRVHYNSNKPAQLQALAYTQGTDIHVAPGQEKHIPHEAWHVVQQKQGRVQPTMQLQGVNVNDNEGLEKEADAMGERGNEVTENTYSIYNIPTCITQMTTVVQRDWECKECGASGKGKGGKKCKECNAITSDVQRRMNFGDWWDSIEDKRRQDLLRSHGSHETSGGVNRGNDEHTGGVARAMKQIKKKYEAGKYN